MLLEISGEITTERMKGWNQRKNKTQLWMWLVIETRSDAVKSNITWAWNVRSMNQGKLEVVKQEMARVNVNILEISELKWTGMGEFNSDDHYIYYCGQESLRRNGVTIIVNKRVWNAVLGCNLKNDRMISVHFQGKPFTITRRSWSWMVLWRPTAAAAAASLQSCPILCDPIDGSPKDLLKLMPKKLKLNGSMKTYKAF